MLVLFEALLGKVDRELGQAEGQARKMIEGLGEHLCMTVLKSGLAWKEEPGG